MKPKTAIPAIEGIVIDDTNGTQITDTSDAESVVIGSFDSNTYVQVFGSGEDTDDVAITSSGDVDITSAKQTNVSYGTILNIDGEKILIQNLPVADPHVAHQLWNDAGALKVSAG